MQPEAYLRSTTGWNSDLVPPTRLGAMLIGIHRVRPSDHMVIDAILRVIGNWRGSEQPGVVGFVITEQRTRAAAVRRRCGLQAVAGQPRMINSDAAAIEEKPWDRLTGEPPGVAEPQSGQHRESRRFRSMVLDRDLGQDLGSRGLGVRDVDRPIPSMIKDSGVHEFKLRLVPGTSAVLIDQPLIRKRLLRIVISPAQPGMARKPIQIPPVLLHILAMVSLRTGKAEHALLQDRINTVPQRQRETQIVMNIRQTGHTIFIPAVGPRPRMIMRKETPGITVVAVVLAHRAPGTLREIGPPLIPRIRLRQIVLRPSRRLSQPVMLCGRAGRSRSRGHDLS